MAASPRVAATHCAACSGGVFAKEDLPGNRKEDFPSVRKEDVPSVRKEDFPGVGSDD